MYIIIEHDMKVHQIIDTKGHANKYGTPKRFETKEDAEYYLRKHKMGSAYGGCTGRYPYYEIKEEANDN